MPQQLTTSMVAHLANACGAVSDRWAKIATEMAAALKDGHLPDIDDEDAGVTLSVRETVEIVKALNAVLPALPPAAPAIATPQPAPPLSQP